jgi:hypothetical protein
MNFYDYKYVIDRCFSKAELSRISADVEKDDTLNDYDRKCVNNLIGYRRSYISTLDSGKKRGVLKWT